MILKRIFNNSGEFIEKGYDPYRVNEEKYGEIHNFLFDEDGGLNHD